MVTLSVPTCSVTPLMGGGGVNCVNRVVCKIPLLARRTRPKGQARRATIGYLVYNQSSWLKHSNSIMLIIEVQAPYVKTRLN